jgi:hypothetical protein
MNNDDLKKLGEVLDDGQAGLLVLYKTNMADHVAAQHQGAEHFISRQIDADADELARQLKAPRGRARRNERRFATPPLGKGRLGSEGGMLHGDRDRNVRDHVDGRGHAP